MIIGIPRALLYYKYNILWETFFKELGIDTIISDETNKEILKNGINYSVDENCLASKIYMGHVHNLIGKCDYIFVPRFCSFKDKDVVCVKFNALYDICVNTFENANFLTYNLDYNRGKSELVGFLNIGKKLSKSRFDTIKAYINAKKAFAKSHELEFNNQDNNISKIGKDRLKVLIVSHPYIIYDNYIGRPVIKYLDDLNTFNIYTDIYDIKSKKNEFMYFSKTIYWKYNKEQLSNLKKYMDLADGIIFMTVFPCGADALVNEISMSKIKNIPMMNLVIDDLDSDTGVITRLESFIDIISQRKKETIDL